MPIEPFWAGLIIGFLAGTTLMSILGLFLAIR